MVVPKAERFQKLGIINDPDTVAADKPDQFGLKLDRMKDGTLQWDPEKFGYSSGIIGIQLFKNEKFDPKNWNAEEYIRGGKCLELPYKVGMAFGLSQKENSIVYHYLKTQEPGTTETSRFPTDSINNPTNINAISRLNDRLKVAHVKKNHSRASDDDKINVQKCGHSVGQRNRRTRRHRRKSDNDRALIDRRREAGIEAAKKKHLELNSFPDFIEDRGHTFGANLSDHEKTSLIEYMKYF